MDLKSIFNKWVGTIKKNLCSYYDVKSYRTKIFIKLVSLSQLLYFQPYHQNLIQFHLFSLSSTRSITCITTMYNVCSFCTPFIALEKHVLMKFQKSYLVACIDIRFLIIRYFALKSLRRSPRKAVSEQFLNISVFLHKNIFSFNFFVKYFFSNQSYYLSEYPVFKATVYQFFKVHDLFVINLRNFNKYEVYQLLLFSIRFHLLLLHVV